MRICIKFLLPQSQPQQILTEDLGDADAVEEFINETVGSVLKGETQHLYVIDNHQKEHYIPKELLSHAILSLSE